MALNIFCDRCNAIIRIRPRPYPDTASYVFRIKRAWVAVDDALRDHGWTFGDDGRAYCPQHSKREVAAFKGNIRIKDDRQFKEDQGNIPLNLGQFNVSISPRLLARFKLATFFVTNRLDKNIRKTVEFIFNQFVEYVLSDDLREKSEAQFQNFAEDLQEKRNARARDEFFNAYEKALAGIEDDKKKKGKKLYYGKRAEVIREGDPNEKRGFKDWRPGS